MTIHVKRSCAAAVAAAAAVALTAGMTAPASGAPGRAGAAAASAAAKAKGAGQHWITLITGDRIAVDGKGRPQALRRTEGRTHIPVQIRRTGGHFYAVPLDAQRLIREGKVDERLFDLTLLSRPEYRRSQAGGVRLIVGYKGGAADAKRAVRDAGDSTVSRTFTRLNAQAVTADRQHPAKVWDALTDRARGPQRIAADGVAAVWLDGFRTANLDKSVPRIGAPAAWKAGYNGKGTKIAVLDTGVDQTHPDLAGQEVAEKNFSDAPDAKDRYGHGTHVASISAGTGAKSKGKYTGVAPGAKLLDGKVLDDSGGGWDSGIIAGMEWAAAQKADVVNLSLGGQDAPGIDPLEEAVNRLSEQTGTLFVVAAGNSGPRGLNTPGSADAALTVGAVDKQDRLAAFSSTGPRIDDGAVKPDLTAPGVDIGAAAAPGSVVAGEGTPVADGYVAISGTSMATPHVAGSAALLKQQHPDWSGPRIKAALTGSTTPGAGCSAFQQGSGRVDVAKAIGQSVVAEPVSLSFGTQQWPHADDKPVTKALTYRNLGKDAVTLDVSVTALAPDGKPAPQGMFTLGQKKVTVPAGGTASVPVTVDTRLGGTNDGAYSAYLVASGGGHSVRTAAAVDREVESYDVTVQHLGRDGKAAPFYSTSLYGLSGLGEGRTFTPYDKSGTVTLRLPKGGYVLDSVVYPDDSPEWKGGDWIAAPKLEITKAGTVTVDARTAKPVDVTVPDTAVQQTNAFMDVEVDGGRLITGVLLDTFKGLNTAHLGPEFTAGSVHQQIIAQWTGGAQEYALAYGLKRTTLATGYTRHVTKPQLATVTADLGSSVPGKRGYLSVLPDSGGALSITTAAERTLPHVSTVHVNGKGATWQIGFDQIDEKLGFVTVYFGEPRTYQAGRGYRETFNVGVTGPQLGADGGLFRNGDKIYGVLPLLADGKGHTGYTYLDSVVTTLYRNGKKVGTHDDPLTGEKQFTVPAGKADYRLTTTVTRSGYAAHTTKVSSTWTFTSQRTAAETKLPASVVRFTPSLANDSTAKAGARTRIPVTVQGPAADNLTSLAVYVSYDGGKKWQKAAVDKGKVTVTNPKAGKGISLKAVAADKKGNRVTQTIVDAYLGK